MKVVFKAVICFLVLTYVSGCAPNEVRTRTEGVMGPIVTPTATGVDAIDWSASAGAVAVRAPRSVAATEAAQRAKDYMQLEYWRPPTFDHATPAAPAKIANVAPIASIEGRAPLALPTAPGRFIIVLDSDGGVATFGIRSRGDGSGWTAVSTSGLTPALARRLAPDFDKPITIIPVLYPEPVGRVVWMLLSDDTEGPEAVLLSTTYPNGPRVFWRGRSLECGRPYPLDAVAGPLQTRQ